MVCHPPMMAMPIGILMAHGYHGYGFLCRSLKAGKTSLIFSKNIQL